MRSWSAVRRERARNAASVMSTVADQTHRFAMESSAVAQVRDPSPKLSLSVAERGAPFHSPINTPESVAVMIMKI